VGETVKPRLNVITLAVDRLERSLAFYRDGLGLPTEGIIGTEFVGSDTEPSGAVAFFKLQQGLILALYPRSDLIKDAKLPKTPPGGGEFSLGYLVNSREAVDELLHRARSAGGTVRAAPHERPWGIYSGYFQDPDGHLWEAIWNPQVRVDDEEG
jgi:catechol 2,3-dioxygenase-like lactoylglutathione lyase family enzyme